MALNPTIRRGLEFFGIVDTAATLEREAPSREGSPEDDAAPPLAELISTSAEGAWISDAYLDSIADNDDAILARDGSGLELFDRLLDDDVAMSAMQQRRLAITSRDYEVAPGDPEDPRSVQAADDFRAMVAELGVDRVTGGFHWGVWFGYAVGEGMWTTRVRDGRTIVWLKDIVIPDRRAFGFTQRGELRLVTRMGDDGKLPDNKFVSIRTGATHDFAFYGLGLAHWAYWPIFFKRAALKYWAIYLEKLGQPTVMLGADEQTLADPAKRAKMLATGTAITRDSAVLLPEAMVTDKKVQLIEATRSGSPGSGFLDFVGAQDDALLRVVLGSPGTAKATPGGLGGDGQASKDEGVKREIVKADSDMISEGFATFARWATRWNYGPDVAPPTLFRQLDDEEDLNTVADRDVKLNGIGIKRTEDSVAQVYGDGYEVDRVSAAEQAALDNAATAAKAGLSAPGGPPIAANDDAKAASKRKIAEFAAQGGETAFSPLYVSRKLINSAELIAWAKSQGINPVAASDLHCTILYSKAAVDWFTMAGEGWDGDQVRVTAGGPRFVERFGHGEGDAPIVLRFADSSLRYRHESMIERGATSDYDEFKPHITISYDGADLDLAKIEPFVGELRFGPEIFEPIKDKATDATSLDFTAADEAAIDRLTRALVEESNPVFAAMAGELRGALQGVDTIEGARIAILQAVERFPIERLAMLTALPMLAERAGARIGAEDLVDA